MAEGSDKASKAALGISILSAIGSAAALLKKQKAGEDGGGNGGGPIELPNELWEIIIAIAQSLDNTDQDLDQVITALENLAINVQGWPTNTDAIQTTRIICTAAATAYRLPDFPIPDGFALVVAAWPVNANLIYIGEDQAAATNPNRIDALAAGGLRTLFVKNANVIWISALAAGDSVTLISEKRKVVT